MWHNYRSQNETRVLRLHSLREDFPRLPDRHASGSASTEWRTQAIRVEPGTCE